MMFELTITQSTVCQLISAAMFQTKPTFDENTDWEEVRNEMRAQTVQGLVMDILPELPIPEPIKKQWRTDCFRMLSNGLRLRKEQDDFLKILEKADIPYVVLKGTAAAMYYPNPFLRGMGDVDVYIPECFHKKVRELLLKEEYEAEEAGEPAKRHITFSKNNTVFEVHRSFATVNGPEEKAYIDGFLEECCRDLKKTVRVEQGETSFYTPRTNVNGLVLLEHIGQHLIAGIGLRQIIDWMMFVNCSLHDNDWEVFQNMAQKAGLERLAKAVTKMCVCNFGLKGNFNWCMDAEEKVTEEILAYLFDSGNFGTKKKDDGKVSAVENRFKNSKNAIDALQVAGEFNWRLYRRHRWLRPFAWIYQIFRYARQVLCSKAGIQTLSKGTTEANRRSDLMQSLNIYWK